MIERVGSGAPAARIREKLEQACTCFPAERERLERAGELVLELDHPFVHRAFEKALEKILRARTPGEVGPQVDSLVQTLESFASFRRTGGSDGVLRRAAVALLGVAVAALALGVLLRVLA